LRHLSSPREDDLLTPQILKLTLLLTIPVG